MLSRGSINGSALNVFAVNAGNFIQEMESTVTVEIATDGTVTAMRGMAADISVDLEASGGLLRRVVQSGHAHLAAGGSCMLLRRPVLVSKVDVAAAMDAIVVRRVSNQFKATIQPSGRATPAWRALRATRPARTLFFADYRGLSVMREDRSASVAREPRVVVVPRDRETVQ